MREKEIRDELELCIRGFLEEKERSEKNGIDNFDELRILEASFNRLFLSVEHLCNCIILAETGNFSRKHFGDFSKLKSLKGKYNYDLAVLYQSTYNFRSYADYRKFPEIKERFNREELKTQITSTHKILKQFLDTIGEKMDVKELCQKLDKINYGAANK